MTRTDPHDVEDPSVYGVDVGPETRCEHYASDRDVIAIRFACCGDYYACLECHAAVADHAHESWPTDEFDTAAVMCGVCDTELTIAEYLACGSRCPACDVDFNPGCRTHWPHYFDVEQTADGA